MTISKASLSQYVDTAKHYAKPVAGTALAVDGTIRIYNAFQTTSKVLAPAPAQTTSAAATPSAAGENISIAAPKRNWDILSRFSLTPVQNGLVGVAEIAAAAVLAFRSK